MSSGKPSKLLDPATLEKGARELAKIARDAHIGIALVGGFALQYFGSPRLTGDIDVIGEEVPDELPVLGKLAFGGIQTETPGGVPADFIVRKDEYRGLYREALTAAWVDAILPAPIVPIEYIAAMKLATRRTKDAADLEWIIAESPIDVSRTRKIITKHLGEFAAREFDSIVELVLWKKSTGKL
jgi:hypothetical protein